MTDPNVIFERAKDKIFIIDCKLGDDNEDRLSNYSYDVLLIMDVIWISLHSKR